MKGWSCCRRGPASLTTILNQSDYDAYPDLQMYPVLATAIVPVYNLKGVKGLVLTRTALAQIFSGQITYASPPAGFLFWTVFVCPPPFPRNL